MAVTRHEARGNAHEPDGGNAGTLILKTEVSVLSILCRLQAGSEY